MKKEIAWLLILFGIIARLPALCATLPQTKPLMWEEEDLSTRLMDGAHTFVEQQIVKTAAARGRFWKRDFTSPAAYITSVQANREHLCKIIGVVDTRLPTGMERYGDDLSPALVAEMPGYRVFQVRWPVLDGLWGSGLLVQPKQVPVARVVLVPDANQTPEQVLGLAPGVAPESQVARWLAENGYEMIVPVTIRRDKLKTVNSQLKRSDQTYREWIYRQAFHMGRHVIGYEVQIALAAVDWFASQSGPVKIGVCGYAEGGLTAFHAVAVDPRIDAALVSGYFNEREQVWSEPIYRNVWSRLCEFGDAEMASLVLPRALIIEHSAVPEVLGHKGALHTPAFNHVKAELARIETGPLFKAPVFVAGADGATTGPFSPQAVTAFAQALNVKELAALSPQLPVDRRRGFDAGMRHQRLFAEMEAQVQGLVRRSEQVREQFFLYHVMPELDNRKWTTEARMPTHEAKKFIEGAQAYRKKFATEAMGQFDEPLLPFNARSRKIAESGQWEAYDVVLDVYPELFAWGVLVLPKDLKPGERRPVVVCQHGLNGLPRQLLDGDKSAYNNVAAKLAERGFIVFAPHNLYRGGDRFRRLDRKANSIKATLYSFIIASHDQILRWLETQPFVDGSRIAFYGLSYGGKSAIRIPPVLERYGLSICSGDFNRWTRKVTGTDQTFCYMRTNEWEVPCWNLGNTFDYAEMAYLMIPRPFMVERGHLDGCSSDQWVAYEYAKVRWLYGQLGLADRTDIEFFQGGHSMRCEGTFDFLHKHLNWPKP